VVEVNYLGRLGNNLFQYVIGRIIAEELGLTLSVAPIPGFPETFKTIEGTCIREPSQFYKGFKIPLETILNSPAVTGYVLRGYFQRSEYYIPHRLKIRRWLKPSIEHYEKIPDRYKDSLSQALVVNVRRTDYTSNGWALPFSYYDTAIKQYQGQFSDLWIVTDDCYDPFFRRFRKYSPNFLCADSVTQITALTLAPRLIMSQSSFSWWGAFLAENSSVIAPKVSFGCWSGKAPFQDADLLQGLDFEHITCNEPYKPSKIEAFYNATQPILNRVARKAQTLKRLFAPCQEEK
jgi:hypothetical protein